MARNILITGGAGFIGTHLADELIVKGYNVIIFDNYLEQAPGPAKNYSEFFNKDAEVITGDLRDEDTLTKLVSRIDAVFHFTASKTAIKTGMQNEFNNSGTTILLEILSRKPVEKIIAVSSMNIYGEGLYKDADGNFKFSAERSEKQLIDKKWEVFDKQGNELIPVPTPELKTPNPVTINALLEFDQERMCLLMGNAYKIPVVGLRLFNTYGPRSEHGILSNFALRIMDGKPPVIFEDGLQKRDFINVKDAVRACRLVLEIPEADGQVFNIGSGIPITISEMAEKLSTALITKIIKSELLGKYRAGDIRHCFADITRAEDILGFKSKISLDEGLREFSEWFISRQNLKDRANKQLSLS